MGLVGWVPNSRNGIPISEDRPELADPQASNRGDLESTFHYSRDERYDRRRDAGGRKLVLELFDGSPHSAHFVKRYRGQFSGCG